MFVFANSRNITIQTLNTIELLKDSDMYLQKSICICPSIITRAAYNIKSITSTICHTCHQLSRTEDILPILRLPVLKDFPTSLAKVLETESLIGSNALYCNICSGVRENDSKVALTSVGNCLIVQLNCFFVSNGTLTKNSAPFLVSSPIEVVTEIGDEVFCIRKFNLAAVIFVFICRGV